MKRYALYPGRGRATPQHPLGYVGGRQLAACYHVPYSECLDTDNPAIKKVLSKNALIHLIHLLPNDLGIYKLPSSEANKLIVVDGLHQRVEKSA